VLRFLGIRVAARLLTRLGPVALVWPAQQAVRTFALGHLFDRYLERERGVAAPQTELAEPPPPRAERRAERRVDIRVDAKEAQRVRRAIDLALSRALTIAPPSLREPSPIDDQRDAITILVDGVFALAAGIPAQVIGRLNAAFDELLSRTSESDG
jgi:hypothetical protein